MYDLMVKIMVNVSEIEIAFSLPPSIRVTAIAIPVYGLIILVFKEYI
jgi:hypothetical protein